VILLPVPKIPVAPLSAERSQEHASATSATATRARERAAYDNSAHSGPSLDFDRASLFIAASPPDGGPVTRMWRRWPETSEEHRRSGIGCADADTSCPTFTAAFDLTGSSRRPFARPAQVCPGMRPGRGKLSNARASGSTTAVGRAKLTGSRRRSGSSRRHK
jgi:hypothetical protein